MWGKCGPRFPHLYHLAGSPVSYFVSLAVLEHHQVEIIEYFYLREGGIFEQIR